MSVVVDKLIVRSECELSRHLTGVDLEAQVHQLVNRNQDRLPLIDLNPQGLYEVYSPTKGLGIMIKEEPAIEISNTFVASQPSSRHAVANLWKREGDRA